jgi:DUF1009 family protein
MTAPASGAAEGPLAIICGGGSLPFTVAEAAAQRGRKVFIYALNGWADTERVANYPHKYGGIGQLGRFRKFAREAGCRDVVCIGSLIRPALSQLRIDLATIGALPEIVAAFRGGDNHLLTGVGRILEKSGFRLLGAHEVAPDILMKDGALGGISPSQRDHADIAYGLEILRATGSFDIGQGVVVANRQVLAIEAAEGTDIMLARIADLRERGRIRTPLGQGVLVKAPKAGQDRRFDLPSIGPDTVAAIKRAGLAGIGVIAGATIAVEPQRVAQDADAAKVFVAGIPEDKATR